MKEKTTGKKKILYYVILAVSVLLLVTATVLTVYFVMDGKNEVLKKPDDIQTPADPDDNKPTDPSKPTDPDDNKPTDPSKPTDPDDNKPTGGDGIRFAFPVASVSISQKCEFHENVTLGWFYEHEGLDFAADAGTAVMAIADGKVESITQDETTGTQIVIDHGDNLKSVYRFVDAASGLKAGDSVVKGQQIATVSEATGNEYKSGTHLHLEVRVNGQYVDPEAYLNNEK